MTIALLFISLAAAALIRLMPLWLWGRPGLATGDVMVHLTLIDMCRDSHHRVPDLSDKFLLADPESYPTFYHQLLSLLPRAAVDWLEPLMGAIVETVHAGLVFAASYYFAASFWGHGQPAAVATVAALAFALTPILLGVENYGRVYRLSPRPFGALLSAASLLCWILYGATDVTTWILAAILFAAVAALSSKFAVQAMGFISLFMALLLGDPRPLLLPLGGFLTAMVLSRGHVCTVLAGHVRHSLFYCTYLRKRYRVANQPVYRQLLVWPLVLLRRPLQAAKQLVTNQILLNFSLCPWLILLAMVYWAYPSSALAMDSAERHLLAWLVAGIASMLITATAWLRFLGEASRYVVYCVTPVCMLCAHRLFLIEDRFLWGVAGIALLVAFAGIALSYVIARFACRSDAERAALWSWARSQPPSTVLTIDLRLSYLICFRTRHRAVHLISNCPSGPKLAAYKRLIPKWYPWPSTDLAGLVRRYQVDFLVVDERAVELIQLSDPLYRYDLRPFEEVHREGRYRVYRTRAANLHENPGHQAA